MSLISQAIKKEFPDSVEIGLEPFVRPAYINDPTVYTTGFYYENTDGDRFYFPTYEEAAEDLAVEIGMDEAEALEILAKGP